MIVRWTAAILVAVMCSAIGLAARQQQPAAQRRGWNLPADAEQLKNPLTVDAKVLATGKSVFTDKCRRCHGPGGLGDGPDADPDYRADMNLTDPQHAARNSDGAIFYKVSNGRSRPKMPAFKDEISKDQIWAVVAYVQSLRKR